MKKIIILIFISLFSFESNAQVITGSLMHDGMQRDYVAYIPLNYSNANPVPLVLNFHGFTSNGSAALTVSNFQPIADTANFIVVCPTGSPLPFVNINHWNVGGFTNTSSADDVSFTAALIDTLEADYNIDLTRVYATGFSNGGFFSHKLAFELSDRIAAIASVSGTFTPQMMMNRLPTHPTPVLQIHGTLDPTVPYYGTILNGGMASVDTVINYWINYNNCDTIATVTALPDISTNDGSTVEHYVYGNGDEGVTVELLKITGGLHDWPGSSGNMDISASREIWKFLSRHTKTIAGLNNLEDT